MADANPYDVLGVAKTATADEVRKAYRKLARKHHPDVNPGKTAEADRFKAIASAYAILSDPAKRKAYDEFGDASLRSGFDADQARAQQAEDRAASRREPAGHEGYDFDLGDLFGTRTARRGPAPGQDIAATVELELLQALRGAELQVDAPSADPCRTCSGAGALDAPCHACGGKGRIDAAKGPMRIVAACPSCGGSGRERCPTCGGAGVIGGTRKVTVRIPPGADDGSRLRVPGLGGAGRMGGPPGDLYLEIHVRPHPTFRREGLDLHLTLPITLAEAYLGASVSVPTPDGPVQVKVPPRSQSGQTLRLRGKGVRRGQDTGHLLVELAVRLPDQEDAGFAEAVRAAEALYSHPVRDGVTP